MRRPGCQRLAAWLAEHHDSVDILVNNAGTTWGAPLEAFPTAGWTKVLGTNLIAPFDLTVGNLPLLRRAGRAGAYVTAAVIPLDGGITGCSG